MQELEKIEIRVGIHEVKFLGFATTDFAEELSEMPNVLDYVFNFHGEYKVNQEKKFLEIPLKITVFDKKMQELGHIKTLISFFVENFDELIVDGSNGFNINNALIATTTAVAVGTTRGMFVICAANSKIRNAIIPIVNSAQFLPQRINQD